MPVIPIIPYFLRNLFWSSVVIPPKLGELGHAAIFSSICVFRTEPNDDEGGAVFTGDGAAVIYANRIIGELKEAGGYDEPGLLMIVRKDASQKEISIPFQAVPSVCR
jgi:hypothetical protein